MRTLTTTGHGTATATPDTAVVRVSAVHQGATLADALAGAESARASVVEVAAGLVVGTVNLSVWPAQCAEGSDGFAMYRSIFEDILLVANLIVHCRIGS